MGLQSAKSDRSMQSEARKFREVIRGILREASIRGYPSWSFSRFVLILIIGATLIPRSAGKVLSILQMQQFN